MEDLTRELLAAAGIVTRRVSAEPISSRAVINRHELITLDDGGRFVARIYAWPFEGEDPEVTERQAKEEWLLPTLASRGVPVPEIVASVPGAVLTTYIDGVHLGDVPQELSAWADAGRTLALAHEIGYNAAGMIVAGGVEPFKQGSWGSCMYENCKQHADRLILRRPDLPVSVDEVLAVASLARPLLDAAPVRLIHNDPHPWNILVREGHCVGWLDWEFAWAADPTWDFCRNEIFRFVDIGPTPKAFYDGYGQAADEAHLAVYELALFLWMANEARYSNHLPVTYAAAERYVSELPSHLVRLRSLLA